MSQRQFNKIVVLCILSIFLSAMALLLSACSCRCRPSEPAWPPANHPEWKRLDPALCHPWPCEAGMAEWPGRLDNLPNGK